MAYGPLNIEAQHTKMVSSLKAAKAKFTTWVGREGEGCLWCKSVAINTLMSIKEITTS